MKKRLLSDVLWEAANEHLSSADFDGYDYTCEAVAAAARHPWYTDCSGFEHIPWMDFIENHPSMHFARELGCDPKRGGQFNEFPCGEERQGVRYMWLLLAMHVAEDEGITV